MAAGEGRRLRPLTELWAKPVLPIGGRPIIATLLHEFAGAGISKVTLVTGHLAEQVEALVGDGSAFGVEISFVRQPEPVGSADAVMRALRGGARPSVLISAADTLYSRGDVAEFARVFAASEAAGAISARRDPPPGPGKPPVAIHDGRVRRVIDDDPSNPLSSAPLWALAPPLVPFLEGLPGPPFELAEAFQRAVDTGREVLGVEIGRTRDLTHPVDLVRENFPYLAFTT
jgi:glucose-1-phosphate thymidylyltransferase